MFQQRLDAPQIGLGMGEGCLLVGLAGDVRPRIDQREELILFDVVVEIDEHLLDWARDERADLDAEHRLHRACGVDGKHDYSRDAPGGCGIGTVKFFAA